MINRGPAVSHPATIMVIDNSPATIQALSVILAVHGHAVRAIPNAELALKIAWIDPPDMILLNTEMLEMGGLRIYEQIKASEKLRDIPLIFINALACPADKVKPSENIDAGFISGPFQASEVLSRVEAHLNFRKLNAESDGAAELSETQMAFIFDMARLSEARDNSAGKHLERVQALAKLLAKAAAGHPIFQGTITPDFIELIYLASYLHDIGKIGIPEAILQKPGALEPAEFAIMKKHALIGFQALETVWRANPKSAFIEMACAIARSHHEKWDGSGYPDGLAGEAIPLAARIMAIVDIYDALRSQRVYKESFGHDETCQIIGEGRETHLDPNLVGVFASIHKEFKETWEIIQETGSIAVSQSIQPAFSLPMT